MINKNFNMNNIPIMGPQQQQQVLVRKTNQILIKFNEYELIFYDKKYVDNANEPNVKMDTSGGKIINDLHIESIPGACRVTDKKGSKVYCEIPVANIVILNYEWHKEYLNGVELIVK